MSENGRWYLLTNMTITMTRQKFGKIFPTLLRLYLESENVGSIFVAFFSEILLRKVVGNFAQKKFFFKIISEEKVRKLSPATYVCRQCLNDE
jgi:hypothetical protein